MFVFGSGFSYRWREYVLVNVSGHLDVSEHELEYVLKPVSEQVSDSVLKPVSEHVLRYVRLSIRIAEGRIAAGLFAPQYD